MGGATLDDALALAVEKFRGVADKAGQPYILHLLRVMLRQSDALSQQAGLLHDLVEDTDVTLENLRERGFSDEVVEAVDALTHRDDESYADYVLRAAASPIARRVKIADLEDNYRLDRVAYRQEHRSKDAQRIERYILSYYFLTERMDRENYLDAMEDVEAKK